MRIHPLFFSTSLAILVLAGAGCSGQAPAEPNPPVTSVPTPTGTPSTTPPAVTPSAPTAPSATSTAGLPSIDATWKTYTNAALKFSFQYPTKGHFVPQWSVAFVKQDDASIKNGCLTDERNQEQAPVTVSLNNTGFCHSSYGEGTAGTYYLIDHYATLRGTQYVVITFTKSYSTVNGATFDAATYRAFLDQIVGTFQANP